MRRLSKKDVSFTIFHSFSVTKEVVSLKDQLDTAHAKIAQGEEIASKAAKLAAENAELKSKLDEVSTQHLVAQEKLQLMESMVSER